MPKTLSFDIRHSTFGIPLGSLQELRDLLALAQLHVRLLPVRSLAGEAPLPLDLAVRDRGADRVHLRPEQLLDRALDVHLRGVGRHLEHERAAAFAQRGRLLGDQRAADDVCQFHNVSSVYANVSCSFSIASRVTITFVVSITSRAVTRPVGTTLTPVRLRVVNASPSSGATSMTSVLPVAPSLRNIAAVVFDLRSSTASRSTTTTAPSFSFCASAARSALRRIFFGN